MRSRFEQVIPKWYELIDVSFLSTQKKNFFIKSFCSIVKNDFLMGVVDYRTSNELITFLAKENFDYLS